MITSSPLLSSDWQRLKKLCLPPQETRAELRYNGLLEFGRPVHGGIAGKARADGLDGRGPDVVRGIEIRFAGAETDDVLAGGPQFGNPGGDRQGGGGLDALYPVCKRDLVQGGCPVMLVNGQPRPVSIILKPVDIR
jgi:hypothetical protein